MCVSWLIPDAKQTDVLALSRDDNGGELRVRILRAPPQGLSITSTSIAKVAEEGGEKGEEEEEYPPPLLRVQEEGEHVIVASEKYLGGEALLPVC